LNFLSGFTTLATDISTASDKCWGGRPVYEAKNLAIGVILLELTVLYNSPESLSKAKEWKEFKQNY